VAVNLHYSRGGSLLSLQGAGVLFTRQAVLAAIATMAALVSFSQYPGQVVKKSKDSPELRAIAVLEWTGEEGKPKSSRLVPVTVYDGEALQDGNVYLARPQPLALAGEVEYELEKNGKAIGLFDIKNSGQEQGSWVGYGAWKPLPVAAPKSVSPVLSDVGGDEGDRPVLHRKHKEIAKGGGSDTTGSSVPSAPSDPDRPTLHKKTTSDDTGSSNPNPTPDPDRPTLHKKDTTGSANSTSAEDSDRPKLQSKSNASSDVDASESASAYTDPDRPRLKRGKSDGDSLYVLPSLMGLPLEMQQAVAVSDVKNTPEHPWSYIWANPGDEAKMKEALESIALEALGLHVPTPLQNPPKRTGTRAKGKLAPVPPATLVPLPGEEFRVFELAYGSGATMVMTAHTDGPAELQKFVTIVAQPDLYGNLLVLLKSVTDGTHLDENPRMRLVDAVDALADNRGELLFELRGATQRQFALYRVLRGRAEKIFVSGGGSIGSLASD